jgi:serine/threonine-protein kinase
MTASSGPSSEREQQLGEVLAEYLRAAEAGRSPDREQWLAQHPDLADELRSFLDNRARLQALASPAGEATVGVEPESVAPALVPYFGDYHLLQELAHGGMGVVYKARQLSLNRLVALKMILPGQLAVPTQSAAFAPKPRLPPTWTIRISCPSTRSASSRDSSISP